MCALLGFVKDALMFILPPFLLFISGRYFICAEASLLFVMLYSDFLRRWRYLLYCVDS